MSSNSPDLNRDELLKSLCRCQHSLAHISYQMMHSNGQETRAAAELHKLMAEAGGLLWKLKHFPQK